MHAPIKPAILILLISLAIFSSLTLLPRTVNAQPYWLEGWIFRKWHKIVGASGAGSDYQVMFNLHYGSGSDDGQDVYLNYHCQTDFRDVRFTKLDHTLLDHWLEIKVDSDYAVFWVEIAYDLSDNRTIYIYYGNTTVSSASNGDATFNNLFDDFEGDSLNTNKWNVSGSISLNSSLAYTGNKSLQVGISTSKVIWRTENYALPTDKHKIHVMYHEKYLGGTAAPLEYHRLFTNGGGIADIGVEDDVFGSVDMYYLCKKSVGLISLGVSRNVGWHRLEVEKRTTGVYGKFRADRTGSPQLVPDFALTDIWIGSIYGANAVASNWDIFYVRKYIYPEPYHISGGSGSGGEEGNPAIAGNIFVDGQHDTTGLNFTLTNATFSQTLIDGQYANLRTGNYTLNATSYFDDTETYHFYCWLSYPLGENQIENTTAPLTNVTISTNGHISLYLETEPHIIDTYIRVNDNPPLENLTFTINDVTYANGQYALLWGGDYSINATVIEGYSFINWASVGGVSIDNSTDPTTTITVTGDPSSITLYLSAPAIHIIVKVDGQEPAFNWDSVLINGGAYRSGDSIQLINGTYALTANLAARHGFSNWTVSASTDQAFFGNQTIGSYNTTTPMNQKTAVYGTSYYLDRRASITKIWLYCWASADVQKGRCGIYSIEGHDIENAVLMGSTQELTGINTTAMWRNFTFSPALTLEAGDYAITIHAGDISAGLRGKYDAETGSHIQGNVGDTYADGLSNPFGSGGSNTSNCYITVYAAYSYDLVYVYNYTEASTFLTTYSYKIADATLTLNLYILPDLTNLYTWIALLLAALFLMVWSPSWFAWGIKKKGVTTETIERLGYALLLFLVGFGLLVMWLYA